MLDDAGRLGIDVHVHLLGFQPIQQRAGFHAGTVRHVPLLHRAFVHRHADLHQIDFSRHGVLLGMGCGANGSSARVALGLGRPSYVLRPAIQHRESSPRSPVVCLRPSRSVVLAGSRRALRFRQRFRARFASCVVRSLGWTKAWTRSSPASITLSGRPVGCSTAGGWCLRRRASSCSPGLLLMHSFGAYAVEMQRHFGWSKTLVAGAFALTRVERRAAWATARLAGGSLSGRG